VDVTAQVYYDRSDFSIDYPVAGTVFHEEQTGEWWGTELQLSKRLWQKHTLTLGAEYRNDFRQDFTGTDASGAVYADVSRTGITTDLWRWRFCRDDQSPPQRRRPV